MRLAVNIAPFNGYTVPGHQRRSHNKRYGPPRMDKMPLSLPFIYDRVTADILRVLVTAQLQYEVVLAIIPRENIGK